MVQASKKITEKTTEVVRPCEENERGAHGEKNARCVYTRENKTRAAKPRIKRYDKGGVERGKQHNKQGRMEEEANQRVCP